MQSSSHCDLYLAPPFFIFICAFIHARSQFCSSAQRVHYKVEAIEIDVRPCCLSFLTFFYYRFYVFRVGLLFLGVGE